MLTVESALEYFASLQTEEPDATKLGRFAFLIKNKHDNVRPKSSQDENNCEVAVPPYIRDCFDTSEHRMVAFKGLNCIVESFITGIDPTYIMLARCDQQSALDMFFEYVSSNLHRVFNTRNYRLYGYVKTDILSDMQNKRFTQPVAHVCGDIFGVNILVIREHDHEWITDIEQRLTVVLVDNTLDTIGVVLHVRNMWPDHERIHAMYAPSKNYADAISFEKKLKKMQLKELQDVARAENISLCVASKRKTKQVLLDEIMQSKSSTSR